MMKITFVRHGKTDRNIKKLRQGKTDSELNDIGIKEVEALKADFEGDKYTHIYSSPMKRAIQTAKILFPESDIIINEDIDCYDFGELDGVSFKEPYSSFPDNKVEKYNGKEFLMPNEGDSFEDLKKRCESFLEFVKNNHSNDDHIAVSTHSTTLEVMKALVEGKDWHVYLGSARDFHKVLKLEYKI